MKLSTGLGRVLVLAVLSVILGKMAMSGVIISLRGTLGDLGYGGLRDWS